MIPSFCSWSGGKDCCLALYLAQQQHVTVSHLYTMTVPGIARSRSHGIATSVLQQQAALMGMKALFVPATWSSYRSSFISGLAPLSSLGIQQGIFGDITTDSHKQWNEEVCLEQGMRALHPLWHWERSKLLDTFLSLGFEAHIICVRDGMLPPSFVGKQLNETTLAELSRTNVDLCGEGGEYHSIVTNGPLFSQPLKLTFDTPQLRSGMWVADATLADKEHSYIGDIA